jgi:cellulose synthase/poly-beta-1,6-N-acetylglucosamine synthase-like glycosyltransferase
MESTLFILIYLFLLALIVGVGGIRHTFKARSKTTETISLDKITVLIPFRNEAESLPRIIQSIKNSIKLPLEIIFINDHSEDTGLAFLQQQVNELPITVVSLPDQKFGKKEALRYGMEHALGDYYLTLDADVFFGSNYFSELEKLPTAHLWILPAILIGRSKKQLWQEIDLHIMNAINVGLYGLFRPVIASGANLLFSKSAYLASDDYSSHQHISSGDDLFLLRDFRKNNKDVRLISDPSLAVYTYAPEGLVAFLHQRIRWISKTSKVKDHFATSLGVIQTVLSLIFYTLLGIYLFKEEYPEMLFLLIVKTGLDLIFYAGYFLKFKRIFVWLLIPGYQVLFPCYNLLLLILIPTFRAKWKGRKVVV